MHLNQLSIKIFKEKTRYQVVPPHYSTYIRTMADIYYKNDKVGSIISPDLEEYMTFKHAVKTGPVTPIDPQFMRVYYKGKDIGRITNANIAYTINGAKQKYKNLLEAYKVLLLSSGAIGAPIFIGNIHSNQCYIIDINNIQVFFSQEPGVKPYVYVELLYTENKQRYNPGLQSEVCQFDIENRKFICHRMGFGNEKVMIDKMMELLNKKIKELRDGH